MTITLWSIKQTWMQGICVNYQHTKITYKNCVILFEVKSEEVDLEVLHYHMCYISSNYALPEWHFFFFFFTIFLGTLQLGSGEMVPRTKFLLLLSLFLLVPARFGMKWRQKDVFNFFELFWECFSRSHVETVLSTNIFLTLLRPVPTQFG